MNISNIKNMILNTDSYKPSHWSQYPEGTQYVESYIEPRKGECPLTVTLGLQAFVREYLSVPVTLQDVIEAKAFLTAHGVPFNEEGWKYIVEKHNGFLPIKIDALPEGTVVENGTMQVRVINTDPNVPWITSYVETALLRAIWYPSTVASVSFEIKQIIKNALEKSADSLDGLPFKLHDFGARGVSSFESAGLGGLGHIVNFMGTDTLSAILFAQKYYDCENMPAFSIPAAEHSTITSWGKEREVDAYRNMLNVYAKPGSLLAVVSDSYDIYNAVRNIWGGTLRQQVIDSGATLVVRPDSGDPATVVCDVLRILDEQFGSTVNSKGFKVLNNVRVIQGDGINKKSIVEILSKAMALGFSADNIAFGMGGGLLQASTRDTQSYAMKACAAFIDGQWVDVYKDPATDKGKRSKRGRQVTIAFTEWDGKKKFKTVPLTAETESLDELVTFYVSKEGETLVRSDTFDAIRARLNTFL